MALVVGSCGKKGAPRAPELAVPEPVSDLKAVPGSGGISLSWSRPTRFVDGKSLEGLAGFVIYRKATSSSCPLCPVPYRQRATVRVVDQERFLKKRTFRFVDRDLASETIYRYRVFSRLVDGSLSEPSNEVGVPWRP